MCGRFSITGDLDFYIEYFGIDDVRTESLESSWNVAPTDPVYTIAKRDGQTQLGSMKWGLVPHWAPDAKSIHINARSATIATSPVFRDSFSRKRCLIPADGFYEWEPPGNGRTPHWVYRADGPPDGIRRHLGLTHRSNNTGMASNMLDYHCTRPRNDQRHPRQDAARSRPGGLGLLARS